MKLIIERRLAVHKGKRLVADSGWKPSHSFVLQFLKWLFAINAYRHDVTLKDTGGTNRTIVADGAANADWRSRWGYVMAGAGNDDYGLLVGTGTAAEANDDYQLQTKISPGLGAGELEYGDQQETDPAEVAGNVDFLLTRNFVNSSGGAITVREIGVAILTWDTGFNARYFLILRDLVNQTVNPAETLTVQYKLRTTV